MDSIHLWFILILFYKATNKHKVTEDFDWYSNINLEHNYSQERILAPFSHRYPAAILNSPGNIS